MVAPEPFAEMDHVTPPEPPVALNARVPRGAVLAVAGEMTTEGAEGDGDDDDDSPPSHAALARTIARTVGTVKIDRPA
jgi:hypothetical protein